MHINKLWELKPRIISHAYHDNRSSFMVPVSTFEFWTVIAVEEGSFFYNWDGVSGCAVVGDIVFCPPGMIFSRKIQSALSFHYIKLNWVDAEGNLVNAYDGLPVGNVKLKNKNRLCSTLTVLQTLATKTDPLSVYWREHLFTEILLIFYAESTGELSDGEMKSNDQLMNTVLELIKNNTYNKLSLNEIAASVSLSPVQLTRRFRKAFSTSPIRFFISIRLQKSKKLLSETELKLSEIARLCGYDNEYYLSRSFKMLFGICPSEYRENYRL